MPDINRDISIEQVDYNIDIEQANYTIEINPTSTFEIQLNEQGPQGARGYTGNGISSYELTSSSGLTDTYTITFTDGNITTVDVTNGRGIVSITGPVSVDNIDTYTINYNDNTTSTFTVTNGIDGVNPTVTVGTTTTGNPGTNASVINSGTVQDVILDFTIPRGDKGEAGAAATIAVGTVTTGLPTDPASVTNVGTSSAAIFNFTIPQGEKGETGSTGPTGNGIASIAKTSTSGLVDTYTVTYTNGNTTTFDVTNGADGTDGIDGSDGFSPIATVSKSGDTATISITDINGTTTTTITDGTDGQDGAAATIAVGTVTTGSAGSSASVVNSGTSSAAVFDFTIPKGDKGDTGDTGAQGVSVTGVTLQSTSGLQKTYRMSFSNNTYFDYIVTDGASGATTWGGITGTLSNQTDLQNALDAKQNTISDLSTIRSGASAGATALQPNDNITELVNNAGYITASALTGYATETWVTNQNYVNGTTLATTLLDYVTNTSLTTTLAGYQPLLVSGTNIKTINNNSILGSGNLVLDGLPSQTGQSGKFLTTDGTDASWATVIIPTPTYDSVNERIIW